MSIDQSTPIKRILVISLTNIGDAVLTFPVIDALKNAYPMADVSVVAAEKSHSLFEDNPNIEQVFTYDKKSSWLSKLDFVLRLRRENFDCVIDLKNSAIPMMLMPKPSLRILLSR